MLHSTSQRESLGRNKNQRNVTTSVCRRRSITAMVCWEKCMNVFRPRKLRQPHVPIVFGWLIIFHSGNMQQQHVRFIAFIAISVINIMSAICLAGRAQNERHMKRGAKIGHTHYFCCCCFMAVVCRGPARFERSCLALMMMRTRHPIWTSPPPPKRKIMERGV